MQSLGERVQNILYYVYMYILHYRGQLMDGRKCQRKKVGNELDVISHRHLIGRWKSATITTASSRARVKKLVVKYFSSILRVRHCHYINPLGLKPPPLKPRGNNGSRARCCWYVRTCTAVLHTVVHMCSKESICSLFKSHTWPLQQVLMRRSSSSCSSLRASSSSFISSFFSPKMAILASAALAVMYFMS